MRFVCRHVDTIAPRICSFIPVVECTKDRAARLHPAPDSLDTSCASRRIYIHAMTQRELDHRDSFATGYLDKLANYICKITNFKNRYVRNQIFADNKMPTINANKMPIRRSGARRDATNKDLASRARLRGLCLYIYIYIESIFVMSFASEFAQTRVTSSARS